MAYELKPQNHTVQEVIDILRKENEVVLKDKMSRERLADYLEELLSARSAIKSAYQGLGKYRNGSV